MRSRNTMPATIATFAAAMALQVDSPLAQSASDLAGNYVLVSNQIEAEGKRSDNFGPNPKGRMMLDANGNFILINGRSDIPKIAAGNRIGGTAEENKAIVQGAIALYGKYTIDAANKIIVFNIEYSTYPNWNGDVQKRPFTFAGDKLTWTVPAASTGRGAAHLEWQRSK